MEKSVKLAVIGGFLGAGKTTTILALAKLLTGQGKRIGIVTNDQGSSLVDTAFLAQHGLPVMEVAGGCFCCNFDEFTSIVNRLAAEQLPDIILAEPVGSCTDLVATIFRPFQLRRAGEFSMAPLVAVTDPRRGLKLMSGEAGFPSEINYLFKKQLEEADIILINKTDKYESGDIAALEEYLKREFPAAVLRVSAKDESTLLPLLPVILGGQAPAGEVMELDYDTYALAEELLGWFNGACMISGEGDIRQFVGSFFERVRAFVTGEKRDIAHLKAHIITTAGHMKASLTSVEDDIEFDEESFKYSGNASMVINARINIEPETLAPAITDSLYAAARSEGIEVGGYRYDCFKPGRPDKAARDRMCGDGAECCCCKKS